MAAIENAVSFFEVHDVDRLALLFDGLRHEGDPLVLQVELPVCFLKALAYLLVNRPANVWNPSVGIHRQIFGYFGNWNEQEMSLHAELLMENRIGNATNELGGESKAARGHDPASRVSELP